MGNHAAAARMAAAHFPPTHCPSEASASSRAETPAEAEQDVSRVLVCLSRPWPIYVTLWLHMAWFSHCLTAEVKNNQENVACGASVFPLLIHRKDEPLELTAAGALRNKPITGCPRYLAGRCSSSRQLAAACVNNFEQQDDKWCRRFVTKAISWPCYDWSESHIKNIMEWSYLLTSSCN